MGYFRVAGCQKGTTPKGKPSRKWRIGQTEISRWAFTFMGYFRVARCQKGTTPKRKPLSEVKDRADGLGRLGLHFHGIFRVAHPDGCLHFHGISEFTSFPEGD